MKRVYEILESACEYCAQVEKLDEFGYCKKYGCFIRSGKQFLLDQMVSKARDLYFNDEFRSVSGPVSNIYSKNHRIADNIKNEAFKEFGSIPLKLLDSIPMKFRYKKWDFNIRW